MSESNRATARQLAAASLARGDPVGWFETLYGVAAGDAAQISWADMAVNPNLAVWLRRGAAPAAGARTLVVGCGLGDDAEELARLGLRVTAFDVSSTAVDWCRRRFPASPVDYQVADVLAPPPQWQAAFGFVFEAYTLQVLPADVRRTAAANIAGFVAPGGTLLLIARGRDPADDSGAMPWPLLKTELDVFAQLGLSEVAFEDYLDNEEPPVRRFRVEYKRLATSD